MCTALMNGDSEFFVQRTPSGGMCSLELDFLPLHVKICDSEQKPLVNGEWSCRKQTNGQSFALDIRGLPCGGPFFVNASAGVQNFQRKFYVGDIWLMAGQSNMEGVGMLSEAAKPHPFIRNFTMARTWEEAREPLHFLLESPDFVHHRGFPMHKADVENAKLRALRGSGLGLHFARYMLEANGIPQGLVACAHGGTSMEEWSPRHLEKGGESLYGSMLASLIALRQNIAGVLWYQGCSDTNPHAAELYTAAMEELVSAVRRDLGQNDLPWITVQIGKEIGRRWQESSWHAVQEAQRLLPSRIPNLTVVASADLEHDDWIHISGKAFPELAKRMFLAAQGLSMPNVRGARYEADEISPCIVVDLDGVELPLSSKGCPQELTLADSEGLERPYVYQVRFEGTKLRLRLTSDDVYGLFLYHGMGCEAHINIYDNRGLPLPVFGPLALDNIPARSPWFRKWKISPALQGYTVSKGLSALAAHALGDEAWESRQIEGWNVVNMHDDWAKKDEVRCFRCRVSIAELMSVKLELLGDGPLVAWLDSKVLVDDARPIRDLGQVRFSQELDLKSGTYSLSILMQNRGGEAYGCAARFVRCDTTILGKDTVVPRDI